MSRYISERRDGSGIIVALRYISKDGQCRQRRLKRVGHSRLPHCQVMRADGTPNGRQPELVATETSHCQLPVCAKEFLFRKITQLQWVSAILRRNDD